MQGMYTIKQLPEFAAWISGLKDKTTRHRLMKRLDRAAFGHLGDVKTVGENLWEMREFFGGGFRMYYTRRGDTIIVMLAGGNKSTQGTDIARARELMATLED
jgi:putative addiction module killer protein